jgi:hypothetical protein
MARFIPVGGEPQEEKEIFDLMVRYANNGKRVTFLHLEGDMGIAFHGEAREINKTATQLAGGETVYGDAVIFHRSEAPAF